MEILIVVIVFAAAIWYLYRRFKGLMDPKQPSCSCSGCGGSSCDAAPKDEQESKAVE